MTVTEILTNKNILEIAGIYEIKNIISNKYYIGESNDIYNRWNQHIKALEAYLHDNSEMQNDYNKYGINTFTFNILQTVEELEKDAYYYKHAKLLLLEYLYTKLYTSKHMPLYNKHETFKEFLMADLDDNKLLSSRNNVGYTKQHIIWCLRNYCFKETENGIEFIDAIRLDDIVKDIPEIKNKNYNDTKESMKIVTEILYEKYNNIIKKRHLKYRFAGKIIEEDIYLISQINHAKELLLKETKTIKYIFDSQQCINNLKLQIDKLKESSNYESNDEIKILQNNYKTAKKKKTLTKPSEIMKMLRTYYRDNLFLENGIDGAVMFGDEYNIFYYLCLKYDLIPSQQKHNQFKSILFENNLINLIKNENGTPCVRVSDFSQENNFIDHIGPSDGVYFNKKGISYIEKLFISTP